MKRIIVYAIAVTLFIGAGKLWANDGYKDHKVIPAVQSTQETQKTSAPIEIGNTFCPVSGEKVGGEMGEPVKYEHEGKIYNLCCKACVKDFKKDPEKYIKILEDKGELKQGAQMQGEDHDQHDHSR